MVLPGSHAAAQASELCENPFEHKVCVGGRERESLTLGFIGHLHGEGMIRG